MMAREQQLVLSRTAPAEAPAGPSSPVRRHRRRLVPLVVALLLAQMAVAMVTTAVQQTPTIDEPVYVATATDYLREHRIRYNPEHPPLGKLLIAAGVAVADPRYDPSYAGTQGDVGRHLLYESGNDPWRVMLWARLPVIALTLLFGLVAFAFARDLTGTAGGLVALALYTFSPDLIAHGSLATLDVPAAGFVLTSAWLVWRARRRPLPYLPLAGAALGAAIATKMSTLPAVPLLMGLAALSVFAGGRGRELPPPDRPDAGPGRDRDMPSTGKRDRGIGQDRELPSTGGPDAGPGRDRDMPSTGKRDRGIGQDRELPSTGGPDAGPSHKRDMPPAGGRDASDDPDQDMPPTGGGPDVGPGRERHTPPTSQPETSIGRNQEIPPTAAPDTGPGRKPDMPPTGGRDASDDPHRDMPPTGGGPDVGPGRERHTPPTSQPETSIGRNREIPPTGAPDTGPGWNRDMGMPPTGEPDARPGRGRQVLAALTGSARCRLRQALAPLAGPAGALRHRALSAGAVGGRRRAAWSAVGAAALVALVAVAVVWAVYLAVDPRLRFSPAEPVPALHGLRGGLVDLLPVPEAYRAGMRVQFGLEAYPWQGYLFGHVYTGSLWYYLPAALLVKTPLGLLALGAAGAVAVVVVRRLRPVAPYLLLPPGVLLAAAMTGSRDFGTRYALFVPMFLAVAAACAPRSGRRWTAAATAALVLCTAVSSLWTFPYYVPYANEAFGGPAQTHRLLHDSNVDWGQDLGRLADRLRQRYPGERVWLVYKGSGVPSYYGIRAADPRTVPAERVHGLLVVSDSALAKARGRLAELIAGSRPAGEVGHSISLFRR
ncbi:phospholipid carrier-dependent glycosyltransferase [Streptomyces fodineus]|uniref:phospholipid carrier-dependent glycosyltransferase n=1 Tax=Streptomyces fodineus TaxID=1904616 RepID=UPI000B2C78A2|nr:phospholipid carrier-dependent glycosyltransferase [Streptomyces fodineus]